MSDEAECKCEEGAPGWMVTFADLMTLLLTFFVLLLSMSTLDNQRVKLALGSLRGALGVLEGGGQPREGRIEMARTPRVAQGAAELMTNMEKVIKQNMDKASDDSLLFAPGSTEILPSAYHFLDDLSATLADGRATAEFLGHADDSKPSGYYETNWEVAAARALAVLQYVQKAGPVPGYRLKASSHGEFQPRYKNDTVVGRARNRRVEIIMTVTSATDRFFYGEERVIRPVLDAPSEGG